MRTHREEGRERVDTPLFPTPRKYAWTAAIIMPIVYSTPVFVPFRYLTHLLESTRSQAQRRATACVCLCEALSSFHPSMCQLYPSSTILPRPRSLVYNTNVALPPPHIHTPCTYYLLVWLLSVSVVFADFFLRFDLCCCWWWCCLCVSYCQPLALIMLSVGVYAAPRWTDAACLWLCLSV